MSRSSKGTSDARARGGRAKGGESTFERRSSRNRVIVLVMVVLMALSLVAVPLSSMFAGGDEPVAPDDPATDPPTDPAGDDPAEPVTTEGPCGPAADDVPSVDSDMYDAPFELGVDPAATYLATIVTTCGDIVIELDAQGAPIATNNLVNLAEDDYYVGVAFHRVVAGFVIQAGDPAGTGCGQDDCSAFDPEAPAYPGYDFEDELATAEEQYETVREEAVAELRAEAEAAGEDFDDDLADMVPGGYERGTVAMANAGPDTNGSQFFIAQADPTGLPGPDYTVLGTVIEGMDVVDDIAASPTDEQGRPYEAVVIRDITIEQR